MSIEERIQCYNNNLTYLKKLLKERTYSFKNNMNTKRYRKEIIKTIASMKMDLVHFRYESHFLVIRLENRIFKNGLMYYLF